MLSFNFDLFFQFFRYQDGFARFIPGGNYNNLSQKHVCLLGILLLWFYLEILGKISVFNALQLFLPPVLIRASLFKSQILQILYCQKRAFSKHNYYPDFIDEFVQLLGGSHCQGIILLVDSTFMLHVIDCLENIELFEKVFYLDMPEPYFEKLSGISFFLKVPSVQI